MSRKVKLKAPAGTDEANFGTERFRVDNDGTVEVPEEAVASLEATGGFAEIKDPAPVCDGHVLVKHDDSAASCMSFERREDGTFSVPVALALDLAAHGFVTVVAGPQVAVVELPSDEDKAEPAKTDAKDAAESSASETKAAE